jgi:chemotaxis protein histidine kinase CheA
MRGCAELRVSQGLELVRRCRQLQLAKLQFTSAASATTTTTTSKDESMMEVGTEEEEQFKSQVEDFVLELVDLSWDLMRLTSREELLGTHFMRQPAHEYDYDYDCSEDEGEMEEGVGSEAWPFVKMIDLEASNEAVDDVLALLMEYLNSSEREEEERRYRPYHDIGGSESESDVEYQESGDDDCDDEEERKRRQQKLVDTVFSERSSFIGAGRPRAPRCSASRDASPR